MFNLKRTWLKSNQYILSLFTLAIMGFNLSSFGETAFLPLKCTGADAINLHCGLYPVNTDKKNVALLRKALLFVPGFTETNRQYSQIINELLNAGFGPIYIYDHRGQGQSPRFNTQVTQQIATVDKSDNYVLDFNTVLEVIGDDLFKRHPGFELSIVSHSMGSLIALNALSRPLLDSLYKISSHVMISPLVAIQLGFPLDQLADSGRVRWVKFLIRLLSCPKTLFSKDLGSECDVLAPGAKFSEKSQKFAEFSRVTSSQERLNLHNAYRIEKAKGGLAEIDQNFIGPSSRWLLETLDLIQSTKAALNEYRLNSLVFISQNDQIVRSEITEEVLCKFKKKY
jgi:pimeloyl-ACP methyl ester carboxylesterase